MTGIGWGKEMMSADARAATLAQLTSLAQLQCNLAERGQELMAQSDALGATIDAMAAAAGITADEVFAPLWAQE